MSNEPKERDSPEAANGRVNLVQFLGRIIGSFLGPGLGIWLGILVGGSLMPIVIGVLGLFAGAFLSALIFKYGCTPGIVPVN
ncbi:MAG: hypothetical protein JO360_17155 [Acidobacteria bacterium]|nr:hypothetical protein [Acidobacteriota bacterium]